MPIVDFERYIGPIKIKGTIDEKAGQIKGEIGTHIPGFGYKSLKPFAGFIKDGVHESFGLGAGITDSYFGISVKGYAVVAQINLPDKGHEFTIFELETTVQGAIRFTRDNNVAYFDNVDGSPCHFEFDSQGFNLPPLDTPIAILTYRSLQKLHGPQTVQGTIEPTKYSFKLQGGEKIEGEFLEPRVSKTQEVVGHGFWNPPSRGGSSYDDNFVGGRVGQPEGNYDGIALPSVGFQ